MEKQKNQKGLDGEGEGDKAKSSRCEGRFALALALRCNVAHRAGPRWILHKSEVEMKIPQGHIDGVRSDGEPF